MPVLAGDQVSASVSYYYPATGTGSNPNIVNTLLASLGSVITSGAATAGTLTHGASSGITGNLNTGAFSSIVEPDNNTSGTPQAYLTILFFDERFNFIAAADGGVAQARVRSTDAGNANASPLALTNIKAPKNGYAYIYISNRSDQDVYFDNLALNITTGNIIEEDHYYAYGLKIAGISSVKLGDAGEANLQNNYKYQGSFSELDADIGWNDFELRNYDAQTGRFVQQDPFGQSYSQYSALGNDPINRIDPSGGSFIPCPGLGTGAFLGRTVSTLNQIASLASIGIHVAQIGAEIYNNNIQTKVINNQLISEISLQVGKTTSGDMFWQSIILAESRFNGAGSGTDWDKNPDPQGVETDDLWKETDDQLFNDLKSTINTYTEGVLKDVGNLMIDNFRNGNGKDFTNHDLDNQIVASTEFKDKLNDVLKNIQSEILKVNGDFSKYQKQVFKLPNFPSFQLSNSILPNSLHTLIGGTQYGKIILTKYVYNPKNQSFKGIINVTIMDDFGVSSDDAVKV